MLKRKPLIPSNRTPEEIIGNKMGLVEAHYTAARKAQSTEEHDRLTKKFTTAERKVVAGIYEELRELGLFCCDIDQHGNIIFGIMTRNDLINYIEALPLIDMKNFNLSVHFKSVPSVTENDIANEVPY